MGSNMSVQILQTVKFGVAMVACVELQTWMGNMKGRLHKEFFRTNLIVKLLWLIYNDGDRLQYGFRFRFQSR